MSSKLRPALFICDIQERFRKAIFGYPEVIATSSRMLKAWEILDLPVYVTTQTRAKLGNTVSELEVSRAIVDADKTKFSMMIDEIQVKLPSRSPVAIVGIESHICVMQTAQDLLARGHPVYIVADGVSSSNAQEKPIALARLAALGATITTSESLIYEVVGDASIPQFKSIIELVKQELDKTKQSLERLCPKM